MYSRAPLLFPKRAVSKRTRALDRIRRWTNLLLGIAQGAIALACFSYAALLHNRTSPILVLPVVPPPCEALVWAAIYIGCLIYSLYQFRPVHQADAVLRRVGFFTASAFLGCCAWLFAARAGHPMFAFLILCWMTASLFLAFMPLWRLRGIAPCFRWCVVAPISIYAAWLSVALCAVAAPNVRFLLGQTSGAFALILGAALLIVIVLRRSSGNLFYSATIAWALIWIGVKEQFELRNKARAQIAWVSLIALVAASVWIAVRNNRENAGESAVMD
jgi:hypothetical protein